jgi:large repetitive protein
LPALPLDDNEQSMSGKATFGFIAKYNKDKALGNLEFQYSEGQIDLKSTSIYWIVVSGSNVQFKGTATINGETGYYFRVNSPR